MEWEPDEQAWQTFINFELRYKEIDRARDIYQVSTDILDNSYPKKLFSVSCIFMVMTIKIGYDMQNLKSAMVILQIHGRSMSNCWNFLAKRA
jgi:hypothetical protein